MDNTQNVIDHLEWMFYSDYPSYSQAERVLKVWQMAHRYAIDLTKVAVVFGSGKVVTGRPDGQPRRGGCELYETLRTLQPEIPTLTAKEERQTALSLDLLKPTEDDLNDIIRGHFHMAGELCYENRMPWKQFGRYVLGKTTYTLAAIGEDFITAVERISRALYGRCNARVVDTEASSWHEALFRWARFYRDQFRDHEPVLSPLSPEHFGQRLVVDLQVEYRKCRDDLTAATASTHGSGVLSINEQRQRVALSFLRHRAMSKATLATVLRVDPSSLHGRVLVPLMKQGKVQNDPRRGGYFRPDAPPLDWGVAAGGNGGKMPPLMPLASENAKGVNLMQVDSVSCIKEKQGG